MKMNSRGSDGVALNPVKFFSLVSISSIAPAYLTGARATPRATPLAKPPGRRVASPLQLRTTTANERRRLPFDRPPDPHRTSGAAQAKYQTHSGGTAPMQEDDLLRFVW